MTAAGDDETSAGAAVTTRPQADSRSGKDNGVQSVDRAISILQVIARHGDIGVTAVAQELGLHKSTVSRLLSTLENRGLVEPVAARGGYRLGAGIQLLAEGATRQPDLTLTSRPVCTALADEVGETVNVVILEGRRAVTIDQVLANSGVATVNWVGRRDWLHATAAGKVFLADLPAPELADFLDEDLPRFTAHTLTDPQRLRRELAGVRERGYGVTYEEQEVGLVALAAPVRRLDGTVIAALSVSGPTFRMPRESLPHLAAVVQEHADRISQRNGRPKTG